jgi:hypothetical protein
MYSSLIYLGAIAHVYLGEQLRQAKDGVAREAQAVQTPRRTRSPMFAAIARQWARVLAARDHSLTDYPCRLPDGRMGRVAAVMVDGEWTLVCRRV